VIFSFTKTIGIMTKYILMVFGGACSYGMLSTFVKLANREGYKAAGISLLQAAIGMVVLWIVVILSGKQKSKLKEPIIPVLFTGVAIGLTTFVYYVAVEYISASLAVVLLMQFAWIGVLLSWIIFDERPDRIQLFSIVLIMAGSILASGITGSARLEISTKGVLYALLSAGIYAIYIVANGNVARQMDTVKKSAITMTGSAAGIFLVNANELISNPVLDLNLLKWASFLSLFGTIIPPLLFARGIPRIGAGLSSLIMTVELPVAVLFAHIVLGEQLEPTQWGGITIMLLALLLLNAQKAGWRR
jgi:drug/metabolite transporter (DMT)-like permease